LAAYHNIRACNISRYPCLSHNHLLCEFSLSSMKIVYRAGDIIEAEIVKGMLLSNDIEAHVSGYYLQGGIGEMAPTDLAKVHVHDEDYKRAREMVLEYEGNQSTQSSSSRKTENVESTPAQKVFITIIVVITISILSYWIGV